jgi:metal-sulfur cluster biosynthetic enzyme
MITRDEITSELKTIFDPEINLDIWTMGLIYNIDIKNNNEVHILMTYTTPLCPFGADLKRQVDEKLTDLGFTTVTIEVTFNPPWKPSEELRLMLGI